MPNQRSYEILSKKRIFDHFFKVDELHLRHSTTQGAMSAELTRLVFERGDAVAALVHNRATNSLILTEQFRAPAAEKGPAWLLELPAGMIDKDEEPASAVVREVYEEIGYRPTHVEFIASFYLSPGGSSERIFLYYCPVESVDQKSRGGGLAAEDEYISRVELPLSEAFKRLDDHEIVDAKTIIGLQWLRMRQA